MLGWVNQPSSNHQGQWNRIRIGGDTPQRNVRIGVAPDPGVAASICARTPGPNLIFASIAARESGYFAAVSSMVRTTVVTRFIAIGLGTILLWTCSIASLPAAQTTPAGTESPAALETVDRILTQVPALEKHLVDVTPSVVAARVAQARNYSTLLREKLQDRWFAALLEADGDNTLGIVKRFGTWREFLDFLVEQEALVEVWAYTGPDMRQARRISAMEMSALKKQAPEQPTFITLSWREPNSGPVRLYRVEFGYTAADVALAASQGYQRHRQLQGAARKVLSARDVQGRVSAVAQWEALHQAVEAARLSIAEMPPKPQTAADPFVAFEYRVDELNNFERIERAYHDSEIEHQVVTGPDGAAAQILVLKKPGAPQREALGFVVDAVSDEYLPASHAVPGQDVVEMRVKDPGQLNPRRWNVLEFGEPELLKESALAKFSLLSAYLDKRRKEVALEQSKYDLIAEPIITGLNVGGGIAGIPFPMGEAARLGYNALVTAWMIPPVPTVKQMRELFQLMAAKSLNPRLKTKPGEFLDAADYQELRRGAQDLTDLQVVEYLQSVSADDLKGMVRLARMEQIDARVTNLLSIMADAGKVSGWTDEAGWQKDVFNSIYFSVTGEVSIKNIIAVLAGGEIATPLSGVSLYDLSRGHGPAEAWLQYLNFTVDIRAVVNQVARWSQRTLAGKELRKPFPYAPRLTDLSAYEIRIFGFPLLMFYKRGLLKKDYAAFENDYAYGFVGATLVEHFPTLADLEAEIRDGNMFPLGYVRVWGADGKWKETNLAVFAHRMRKGKHAGKTSVIIYGLKAYVEQSQLIERELKRFQEFEQVLQQGGVIEQVVDAEDRQNVPMAELEPQLHVGRKAADEFYSPLLGGLLEWRRYLRKKEWGLPMQEQEFMDVAGVLEQFGAKDIWLDDDDCLLRVGAYNSDFLYRRYVHGNARLVRVTNVPTPADVERDTRKAQDAQQLERTRRGAVSEGGHGIVLVNQVRIVNGRPEIGPIAFTESSAEGIQTFQALLDRMPVIDRARLHFNNFAGTLIDFDFDGHGKKDQFFLTIEFPSGQRMERVWTNPLSGKRELLIYEEGLWKKTITDSRIVEMEYNAERQETASRTYANTGTREKPQSGELLEETRTLETWERDLNRSDLDPYLPMISKLKVNHVTGQSTCEIYGLFPSPVAVIDDQFITYNLFNDYGVSLSAKVFENGRTDRDFDRPLLTKITEPVMGREHFQLVSVGPPPQLRELRSLKSENYVTTVRRRDLVMNSTRTERFDNAHFGRRIGQEYTDPLDGTNAISIRVSLEYRDDFFHGEIPVRTVQQVSGQAKPLTEVQTRSYDPVTRRMVGVETDYTGKVLSNTWDYRWEAPVQIETSLRKTVNRYNRDGTELTGTTSTSTSGEEVARLSGRIDTASEHWQLQRVVWYRPGVTNRVENLTLSRNGRLLSTRIGDLFEAHPVYGTNGQEQAVYTYRRNATTRKFELVHELADNYQWTAGQRDARIQLYVDGQPYDAFRRVTDAEGRTVLDGLRQFPGLGLRTTITYDGGTERALRTELLQNNQIRLTREFQPDVRQPDGSYRLQVKTTPYWGLAWVESLRLGDVLARPLSKQFENDESANVTQWYDGTAIARTSELRDAHGRLKARFNTRLNAGIEGGIPYDLLERESVSFWGQAAPAERKATVRGTDVALFKTTPEEKTYYSLGERFDLPRYTIDPRGRDGLLVTIGGTRQEHVLALFSGKVQNPGPNADAAGRAEQVLALQAVDLRGLMFHKVSSRTIDRVGNVLTETVGKIPVRSETDYTEESLLATASKAGASKRFRYHYNPGWLVERPDPATGRRMLVFTEKVPTAQAPSFPVNTSGRREWVTEIDGIKSALEEIQPVEVRRYFFRRIHQPAQHEENPYLPGVSNVWTSWVMSELKPDGEKLFDSEVFYDAQGCLSVTKTTKVTSGGQPGTRIAYRLPELNPSALKPVTLAGESTTIPVELGGATNLAPADFVYLYLDATNRPAWQMVFLASNGRQVTVRPGDQKPGVGEASPWPLGSMNTRWLPNRTGPEHGTLVNAPASAAEREKAVVIAVADLERAGLDTSHLGSVKLTLRGTNETHIGVSPLGQLVRGGGAVPDREVDRFAFDSVLHSSGLSALTKRKQKRSAAEVLGGLEQEGTLELNGLPIAGVRPRSQIPVFPMVVLMDNSDADAPRPLYALSLREGSFLEHYKMPKWGDAQVYTIVNGFDVPKYNVFSAHILDDEVMPSFTAYGYDYAVTLETAKASGWLGRNLATVRNRIAANIFKLAGTQATHLIPARGDETNAFAPLPYSSMHNASTQAQAISTLPMLGQALVLARSLPWTNNTVSSPDLALNRKGLATNLIGLHVRKFLREKDGTPTYQERRTGLIPTVIFPERKGSPGERAGDDPERFVDTAQEGEIIQLAVALNEFGLSRALLDYYWQKSLGGAEPQPLHSSYDAETQASKAADPLYQRPPFAKRTARAQLSIAEAAFALGTATGDTNALAFGANLLDLVLDQFRDANSPLPAIAEYPVDRELVPFGVHLWPEREVLSAGSNARAYLLLQRLSELARTNAVVNRFWTAKFDRALQTEESWLRANILAQAERTGVAPKGLFQVQDVHEGSLALAVER
jgi:hypothetical protein